MAKVSKIFIWPSRKVNLGNYNTVDLSAGVEMTFDTPVKSDSKEVKEAFAEANKLAKEEMAVQFEPYKKIMEAKKAKGGEEE